MKPVGLCLCILVAAGVFRPGDVPAAESAYIVDVIRVSVRSGPAADQKSVGLVESGNPVEVLKPGDEWSLIRLPGGAEGYVQSRYLTSAPPTKYRLDQLQEKQRALSAQAAGAADGTERGLRAGKFMTIPFFRPITTCRGLESPCRTAIIRNILEFLIVVLSGAEGGFQTP